MAPIVRRSHSTEARGLALFTAAFFALWTARVFALALLDRSLQPPLLCQIYLDSVRVLIWLAPVAVFIKLRDGEGLGRSLMLTTPVDRSGLVRGGVIAILYIAGSLLLSSLATGDRVASPLEFGPGSWLGLLLTRMTACFAEEVVFRGFLLRRTWELTGFGTANLLVSALFAAIHWPGWLAFEGLDPELATRSISVFTLGLVLGYVLKASHSLWPCIAVHLLNNASVSLLGQPGSSGVARVVELTVGLVA